MLVLGPPARAWKRKRYAQHDCFRPRRTGGLVEVSACLGKTEVIQGKRAHLHRAQPDRAAEVALKLRPAYSPVLLRKQPEYYHRPSECSPLSERKTEKKIPPTDVAACDRTGKRQSASNLCSRITLCCSSPHHHNPWLRLALVCTRHMPGSAFASQRTMLWWSL
jgi:hypothetical protein